MGRRLSYYDSPSPSKYPDSPSRQLINNLNWELENLHIFTAEIKRVKAYERRSFYERLDRIDQERAASDNAALDKVAAAQDKLRGEAEETLKAHLREEEERRLRREERERKKREKEETERLEKERKDREEAQRKEEERKAKEEEERKAKEEEDRKRLAAEDEARRKEEEDKRKAEEEKQKAERETAQRKAQKAQVERQRQLGGGRQTEEEVKVQQRYIELHQHLKKFRKWIKDVGKENQAVKQSSGDIRRSIKKCVGQLREGKLVNKAQHQEIKTTLEKASSISEPAVDIREFFAFPPAHIANAEETKVPALLIYGLNILSKAIISALVTEASINPSHAEPIGIAAAQIFSTDSFVYRGCPMSDLLWAKYRVVCPALWGFYGDEKTNEGKGALGWWRESPDGPFIGEQGHVDRMTALGAGFAAITLRNFGKTNRRNPFPNDIFWHCLYKMVSIPVSDIQDTHVLLLASALRAAPERILGFFGQVGLALLRRAIVDLPAGLGRTSMGLHQLTLLKEQYFRDKRILI